MAVRLSLTWNSLKTETETYPKRRVRLVDGAGGSRIHHLLVWY